MAVDLTLAKSHLRVTSSDEDTLIGHYLAAAKDTVEQYTGMKLTRGEVEQTVSYFGIYTDLQWGPNPADVTVEYQDVDDAAASFTDARLVGSRLYAPDAGWPSIYENTPITLTYTAGFTTVPSALDQAVLLLVGEYFDNRDLEARPAVSAAVESLCRPYRSVLA